MVQQKGVTWPQGAFVVQLLGQRSTLTMFYLPITLACLESYRHRGVSGSVFTCEVINVVV